MKDKKRDWGWVIEVLPKSHCYRGKGRKFYSDDDVDYITNLKNAFVLSTREDAREMIRDFGHEVVRKVRLNSKGTPVTIIGRG